MKPRGAENEVAVQKIFRKAGLVALALSATVMTGVIIAVAPDVSLMVLGGLIFGRVLLEGVRWKIVGGFARDLWHLLPAPKPAPKMAS